MAEDHFDPLFILEDMGKKDFSLFDLTFSF